MPPSPFAALHAARLGSGLAVCSAGDHAHTVGGNLVLVGYGHAQGKREDDKQHKTFAACTHRVYRISRPRRPKREQSNNRLLHAFNHPASRATCGSSASQRALDGVRDQAEQQFDIMTAIFDNFALQVKRFHK
jgi:hypothetical protein